MLQLCQLYLQLAFVGAGALGKDIENQACAVENTALQRLFKIALLAG
jgi:hypothetical protein